eukprot:m.446344 g.446344  ORF g.446344 m.446344 type:complete len:61 (+) comp148615_c0_seq1:98-280(+)
MRTMTKYSQTWTRGACTTLCSAVHAGVVQTEGGVAAQPGKAISEVQCGAQGEMLKVGEVR